MATVITLANRELAENRTWAVAVTWLECPLCGYLSHDMELHKPAVPCPHCNKSGESRRTFPDMSSVRLLEMIAHFYARACERVDDSRTGLVEALRKEYRREFSPEAAAVAAHEVQRVHRDSDGSQAALDSIRETIRQELALKHDEDPLNAHVPLASHCETHEEHQVVVLLAVALLEKLFEQLLLQVFVRSGRDEGKARKAVAALRGHGNREKVFAGLAGTGLDDAISKSCVTGFHANWQEIRAARNKFIHRSPFAIGASHTEKAFGLAKDAFRVFAHLHNQFV